MGPQPHDHQRLYRPHVLTAGADQLPKFALGMVTSLLDGVAVWDWVEETVCVGVRVELLVLVGVLEEEGEDDCEGVEFVGVGELVWVDEPV